jgi:hypothetical protein
MATLVFRPRNHVFSPKPGDVMGYRSLDVDALSTVMSSRHFRIVDAASDSVRIQHLFPGSPGGLVRAGSDAVEPVPCGAEITLRAGDKYRVLAGWDLFFVEFYIEEESGAPAEDESPASSDDPPVDKNGYATDDDFVIDDEIEEDAKRELCFGVPAMVYDELKQRTEFRELLSEKEVEKSRAKNGFGGKTKVFKCSTLDRMFRRKAASVCGAKLEKLVSGSHEIMTREMKLLAVKKLIVEMGQSMQGLCAGFSLRSGALVVEGLDQVCTLSDTVLGELRLIAEEEEKKKKKQTEGGEKLMAEEGVKLSRFAEIDEKIDELEKMAKPNKKTAQAQGGAAAPKKRKIVPTVTVDGE